MCTGLSESKISLQSDPPDPFPQKSKLTSLLTPKIETESLHNPLNLN